MIDERFDGKTGHNTMVLRDVTIYYPYLDRLDTQYEHCWSVTAVIPPVLAEHLSERGVNVKKTNKGHTIKIKKKERTRAGKQQEAPRVIDNTPGQELKEGVSVGGGSVCDVEVWMQYYNKPTLSVCLNAVQVNELVPYIGGSAGLSSPDADSLF